MARINHNRQNFLKQQINQDKSNSIRDNMQFKNQLNLQKCSQNWDTIFSIVDDEWSPHKNVNFRKYIYIFVIIIIIMPMMKSVKVFRRSLNFYHLKSLKLFLFYDFYDSLIDKMRKYRILNYIVRVEICWELI